MATNPPNPVNGQDPVHLAFGGGSASAASAISAWLNGGGTLATLATISGAVGAAYTQTFSTADKTHAARTAAAVASPDATDDASTLTLVNEIKTVVNALRADLADTAAVVNAIVDDGQALGLWS